jgi:hypothetical protein
MGSFPILQLKVYEKSWASSGSIFMGIKSHLLKLIHIPDNCSKQDRIHFRFLTDSILLSKKSKVSSAYCMLIIPDGQKDLNIPDTRLLFAALISMRVNTSATKLNKIGEIGSPCLTPLLASK